MLATIRVINLKRIITPRSVPQLSLSHCVAAFSTLSPRYQSPYTTTVDAEPLHRYQKGGYHPVTLDSSLKNKRYKILHKLGWGGYSTVWAARDQRDEKFVAIKICISERGNDKTNRELDILTRLISINPSPKHIVHLFDHFDLNGPNGTHKCLVFELLGPSIPDMIDARFPGGRLPGTLAKSIAKQALLGLDALHQFGIAHGDIHTRNLAFTAPPSLDNLSENEFINLLGKPEIGHVQRHDGRDLEPGVPSYIVRPASYRSRFWSSSSPNTVKIVDFGESFLPTTTPKALHTPLPVRAPEVIFNDRLDYRVDLLSMGCMLFELFVGQPPFDTFLLTPEILIDQMQEMASDTLPRRWQETWRTMKSQNTNSNKSAVHGPASTLQEWLEETYFDSRANTDLTRADIACLGRIISRLLRFEPSSRAEAREILRDPWFRCD